ncbi:MAG: hypothetical protein ABR955_01120 [Verrucomicrobiota bacterium]|jgi:hypothetical protein
MFRYKTNKDEKEPHRFYLLPGLGGKAWRRKQNFILGWTVIAALAASAILSALLYWFDHRPF